MSRKSKSFNLPLKNITTSLNSSTMSYTNESGFSSLTNSPMSNLAFNLSELSTGKATPRLRRKLSLNCVDTPPSDVKASSAESGSFPDSPLGDSPTLESLSIRRYTSTYHPDIPLEAISIKKKTIAFRRFSSEPLPALRLDSPTDFLDKDDHGNDENVSQEQYDSLSEYRNPVFSDETMSQDSGLGFDTDKRCSVSSFEDVSSCLSSPPRKLGSASSFDDGASTSSSTSSLNQLDALPSLEDLWNDSPSFKAPKGKPPKRSRSLTEDKHFSEDTCSPIKYSPVKSPSQTEPSFAKALFTKEKEGSSESMEEDTKLKSDDGFQEIFEFEDLKSEANDQVPSLISATLLYRPSKLKERPSEDTQMVCTSVNLFTDAFQSDTPSSRPIISRRGLNRSQSLDIRPRPSFKRVDPPNDGATPVQSKRFRGETDTTFRTEDKEETNQSLVPCARRLHRCHSETEAMIKSAVSRMYLEPNLIGDCSKPYCLPTVKGGKHEDLKSITPETLMRLLVNEFAEEVGEFHIIDCRYPYEYEGGHIRNAVNIYTKDAVVEKYLKTPKTAKDSQKRMILIFHCEFSSERGPRLFRFLRSQDRESNKECYPYLHYPEIYLLEGGYKSFFENYSHLCEPREYKTMFDKNHSEDLRKFRATCKSWSEDKPQRNGVRNLKF
ncbi:M-phase inducer phosphatase-like isoform X1 [Biomphalaria glabrata]|uniref:M-phase inducer phosphatase n=1 Tax=Biomphalaria glabrata TaxID=6526 RepID=A0A9U8E3X6_BIOGL|nr:M-phase inducer phosphatase-like isoform X1 [Biomphalaria glabrata]